MLARKASLDWISRTVSVTFSWASRATRLNNREVLGELMELPSGLNVMPSVSILQRGIKEGWNRLRLMIYGPIMRGPTKK